MGRRKKCLEDLLAGGQMLPLREDWRQQNRAARAAKARARAMRRQTDKARPKCRCQAYPWPHRPGGGFCRHPDPPIACYVRRMPARRLHRWRYTGLRRQIARGNGLHPIRDRAAIAALMPRTLPLVRELHRLHPMFKYRFMQVTERGVCGQRQTAGPMM